MAPINFLNLLAISSLSILACSFGSSPVNALVTDGHRIRDVLPVHGHGAIAKRKRATAGNGKRCKTRPDTSSSKPKSSTPNDSSPKKGSTPKKSSTPKKDKSKSSPNSSVSSTSDTAPSTSSGNGKVGLAWPDTSDPALKNFKTNKVKYIYTWTPEGPPTAASLGLEFIPMFWGVRSIDSFTKHVKKGYANIVFGFNEPNEEHQSWLSVDKGIELWKQYIEPLRHEGYQLVSPATSSNPNGKDWVNSFVKKCGSGCTFDAVAVHYYDVSGQGFIKYMQDWHSTFGKPLYVTEFACQNYNLAYENNGQQCSESQVQDFVATAVNFMESTDWVIAYFPYGFMRTMDGVNQLNKLMTTDGQPTALGKQYIY